MHLKLCIWLITPSVIHHTNNTPHISHTICTSNYAYDWLHPASFYTNNTPYILHTNIHILQHTNRSLPNIVSSENKIVFALFVLLWFLLFFLLFLLLTGAAVKIIEKRGLVNETREGVIIYALNRASEGVTGHKRMNGTRAQLTKHHLIGV